MYGAFLNDDDDDEPKNTLPMKNLFLTVMFKIFYNEMYLQIFITCTCNENFIYKREFLLT